MGGTGWKVKNRKVFVGIVLVAFEIKPKKKKAKNAYRNSTTKKTDANNAQHKISKQNIGKQQECSRGHSPQKKTIGKVTEFLFLSF